MIRIRWANQFPPTTERGGYEVEYKGVWKPATLAEVRKIRGVILWIG